MILKDRFPAFRDLVLFDQPDWIAYCTDVQMQTTKTAASGRAGAAERQKYDIVVGQGLRKVLGGRLVRTNTGSSRTVCSSMDGILQGIRRILAKAGSGEEIRAICCGSGRAWHEEAMTLVQPAPIIEILEMKGKDVIGSAGAIEMKDFNESRGESKKKAWSAQKSVKISIESAVKPVVQRIALNEYAFRKSQPRSETSLLFDSVGKGQSCSLAKASILEGCQAAEGAAAFSGQVLSCRPGYTPEAVPMAEMERAGDVPLIRVALGAESAKLPTCPAATIPQLPHADLAADIHLPKSIKTRGGSVAKAASCSFVGDEEVDRRGRCVEPRALICPQAQRNSATLTGKTCYLDVAGIRLIVVI